MTAILTHVGLAHVKMVWTPSHVPVLPATLEHCVHLVSRYTNNQAVIKYVDFTPGTSDRAKRVSKREREIKITHTKQHIIM